jgi:hypothetical protein
MDLFSGLPAELLILIFSNSLRHQPNPFHDQSPQGLRHKKGKLILAMSKTNRRLWSIARPFLYYDIELLFKPDSATPKFYQPIRKTFLLIRSIHEDQSLSSYVQSLDVQGLTSPAESYRYCGEMPSITYTSDEVTNLLTLFINNKRVYFYGGLAPDIQDRPNQIIISSVRRMSRLKTLVLEAEHDTGASVIHCILSAASNTLKELNLAPQTNEAETFVDHSVIDDDDNQFTDAQFLLEKLTLPASRLPLAAFRSWMTKLSSLALDDVVVSHGQASQGANIKELVAPLASRLRCLALTWNPKPKFDSPSLADFDMSSMTALVFFSYSGPWWIEEDMIPLELCHNLFSRKYEKLSLRFSWETERHLIDLGSVRIFQEALKLACLENRTPKSLKFELDITNEELYDYHDALEIKNELESAFEGLLDHGVEVKWSIDISESPSDLEEWCPYELPRRLKDT